MQNVMLQSRHRIRYSLKCRKASPSIIPFLVVAVEGGALILSCFVLLLTRSIIAPHFAFGQRTKSLSLCFARFLSCFSENASNSSDDSTTFSSTSVKRGIVFDLMICLLFKVKHAHDLSSIPLRVHRKQCSVYVPCLCVRVCV